MRHVFTTVIGSALILAAFGSDVATPATRARHAVAAFKCTVSSIDASAETPLQPWQPPENESCQPHLVNGFLVPDPRCTPGAINPTVTIAVLRNPAFKTDCIRDKATSAGAKDATYVWYGIKKPEGNTGKQMTCEKDHFISLELGGSDTLDNIWPECGPDGVPLDRRFFKEKDRVENYLADQVEAGSMSLEDAQRGIASDWTQYIAAAKLARRHGKGRLLRHSDK